MNKTLPATRQHEADSKALRLLTNQADSQLASLTLDTGGGSVSPTLGGTMLTHDDAIALRDIAHLTVHAVMLEALAGCKRQAEFAAYYDAYLLDQLTDDEFEEIAKQFSVSETHPDDELAERIRILQTETGAPFPVEQLAFMFGSPVSQVRRVMKRARA